MTALVAGPLPFVGRDDEMACLRDRLAEAEAGRSSIVLVGAEAGGGKTRLASEVAAQARAGGRTVVWARCRPSDGAPQLWPWTEALQQARRAQPGGGQRPLDPALAAVLPELGAPAASDEPVLSAGPARFRLFAAMAAELTGESAPLLVVVDDVHWADRASLLFLEHLGEALVTAPVGVVLLVLYRGAEAEDGPVGAALTALARHPVSLRFELRGLDPEAVATCLEAVTGRPANPAAAQELARRTGGNPFFVGEVARLLPRQAVASDDLDSALWRVPPHVRTVLLARLEQLDPAHLDVLRTAAVVGAEFSVAVVARAAGQPTGAVEAAAQRAAARRLLTPVPGAEGRWAFEHALIRETLDEQLTPEHRSRLHAAVADALRDLEGATPAQLAHHLREAATGDDPDAVARALVASREAGRAAADRLAYEDAVTGAEAALALARRTAAGPELLCDLELELGQALNRAGDTGRAQQAFLAAAAAARRCGRGDVLVDAALGYRQGLATGFEFSAPEPELSQLLREALEVVGEDDGRRSGLLARLAMELYFTAPTAEREALAAEAVAVARRQGDRRMLAEALIAQQIALWSPDDARAQLAAADEAVALAQSLSDLELEVQARYWRVTELLELGLLGRVADDVETVERLAGRLRQPIYLWWAALRRAMRTLFEGRFDEAEQLAVAAFDTGYPVKPQNAWQSLSAQLLLLRSEQGRLGELDGPIEDNLGRHPGSPVWRCARAFVDAALGRPRAAALLPPLVEHHADCPRDFLWMVSMAQLVAVARDVDDADSARALHGLLLPYDGQWVSVGPALVCYGSVARLLGVAASTAGDADTAVRHLTQAHAAAVRAGSLPWQAHALHDLAAARVRAGTADATARRLALEALGLAEQLGMTALAARTRTLVGGSGPDAGLTPREREVLELARAGAPAREIARRLVISERTAESHLASIYRKLGVRSRLELLAAGPGRAAEDPLPAAGG